MKQKPSFDHGKLAAFLLFCFTFALAETPALALDKMTSVITKADVLATPEGQKYEKTKEDLLALKESAIRADKEVVAKTLMDGYRDRLEKFKKTEIYKRIRLMGKAVGKRVTCYGTGCYPDVYVRNALRTAADGGFNGDRLHCLDKNPCTTRKPTEQELANNGYTTIPTVPSTSSDNGECGQGFLGTVGNCDPGYDKHGIGYYDSNGKFHSKQ